MANESNDEYETEVVEQVSTMSDLRDINDNDNTTNTQKVGWKTRLDKSMISLEQHTREFNKKLQPQLSNINKLITAELHEIEPKKSRLGEQFKSKLDEYKKVSLQRIGDELYLYRSTLITHPSAP